MQLNKDALALAQTHFYTLGSPRNFTLTKDLAYLYFTRSPGNTEIVHGLWRLNIVTGHEEKIFDPLTHGRSDNPTPEEEKQRERLRETSSGITGYTLSSDDSHICFVLGGSLWIVDARALKAYKFKHVDSAFDAHFSPDGKRISYVNHEGLWLVEATADAEPKCLLANESEDIYWGRAEFIASEEFERYRGYWWSPDSSQLVVSHVDECPVQQTYAVSDDPWQTPEAFRYPAAGTPNADVSLHILNIATGVQQKISYDTDAFSYVTNVQWKDAGLYITLQSRNQRTVSLQKVADGAVTEVHRESDKQWVDILQPLPIVTDGGDIIAATGDEKRGLSFNGKLVTPSEHHVDDFIGLAGNWLVYAASPDPKERTVFAVHPGTKKWRQLSPSDGLFSGLVSGDALFVAGSTAAEAGQRVRQLRRSVEAKPQTLEVRSHAAEPAHWPTTRYFSVGPDKLQASLTLPQNHRQNDKLPVLLQVYGGPHHQEVMLSPRSYLEAQWWADQGFAVLSADGSGTPGQSNEWERRIHGDLITDVAKAQINVLDEALRQYPFLDTSRVAVRGWSFGGYLSAFLSVLYPDKIHASISGAPVTDWRLYDTHYTERYLGFPKDNPAAYETSSLLAAAKKATRPILLIHGLNDDNVLLANSLQLLKVLAESNCPYQFVPLSGASHFTKQAEQRAWLLQMELNFLRSVLG